MAIGEIGLNSSMRSNLISLQTTAQLLGATQERLATGKRVNTAIDSPANFFAAQGHTSRANQLTGLKDGISEAIQTVKAADSGIRGVLATVESLRGVLAQARSAINDTTNSTTLMGASATAGLVGQYNRLIGQLNNQVNDASYKGVNFLTGSTVMTVNFNETATTKIVMSGFTSTAAGLAISGGTAATGVGMTGNVVSGDINEVTEIDNFEASLNKAIATLQTESGTLSANLSVLTTRQKFIGEMVNTLVVGATKLTEADTNEEGANLLSLQTRQQLGTTALSISAQAEQSILRLF
jgi:flagellin